MKTTIYITAWNDEEFKTIVEHLRSINITNPIFRINEKSARAVSMNKALKSCKSEFICFMDCDIRMFKTPFIESFENIFQTHSNIGMIVVPGSGVKDLNKIPTDVKPPCSLDATNHDALKNVSNFCPTLHCSFLRVSDGFKFDEDYINHQVFDVDFAREIAYQGKYTVADGRHWLFYKINDYNEKSLLYHAMAARNIHLLALKWSRRDTWISAEGFIPTYAELLSWPETKLFDYIKKHDIDSWNVWLKNIDKKLEVHRTV